MVPCKDGVVLMVLPHNCNTQLRCFQCCKCHAKWDSGDPSAAPATQNETEVLQVQRLPRKKWNWGAPSAAPATQNDTEVLQGLRLPRKRTRRPQYSIIVLRVLHLPRTSLEVLRVLLHLPRKMTLRCSECCTCHAQWDWAPPSATALAMQKQPAPIVLNRRRSVDDVVEMVCWWCCVVDVVFDDVL